MNNKYIYKEFINRENNMPYAPYNPELDFYSTIKSGNLEKTAELCKEKFSEKSGLGKLSENNLQNYKYHFVITAAILARYCIEGGLDITTAFGLSDYYIQTADKALELQTLDELHASMCLDYATRMNRLIKDNIYSKPIVDCINYISAHLHLKLSLSELAEHVQLNPSYLSRLFKKETGKNINEYINNMKLETAKNMLLYSDYSSAEIASILSYSDQSYFTDVFRKNVGITPNKFRNTYAHHIAIGKGNPQ